MVAEQPAMNPLHPNTGLLPPTLRALALGLLVETVVPMLTKSRDESPAPPDQSDRDADARAELWQDLRGKCDELSTLVLRADDPEEAAAYVLDYLPKHFDFIFELLCGQKRGRVPAGVGAVSQVAHRNGKHTAERASEPRPSGSGRRSPAP
jgi:hypothetical protein